MAAERKKRTLSLVINQNEPTKVYSIYFESMTYGWMPQSQKQLVVGDSGLPEDWLEELKGQIEEEGYELLELRCYAAFENYDFLKDELFHHLKHLYLFSAAKLKDLSFLDNMDKLRTFRIEGAELEDLSPLTLLLERQEKASGAGKDYDFLDADELGCLGLVNCGLKDLSCFEGLNRAMTELHLSYNKIEDIRPVAHLVNSHAFFQHNQIKTGFAELCDNMYYPVDINIRHNLIDDEELERTFEMNPDKQFIHLYIHHNPIKNYSVFKDRGLSRTDISREEMQAITAVEVKDEAYDLLKEEFSE